jgi:redox-sensitive bicupin YhaK (pirin superfamily)
MQIARTGIRVVPALRMTEGAGFVVHRPFPVPSISQFDPILLVDEMGPVEYKPGEAKGAPDHPHRGFETVTYIIEGAMQHEDSHGHRGVIRSGDVQWMTAGAGVIHSEMPTPEMMRDGGRMHGFQIWVNLPHDKKMMQPRYQEYAAAQLPLVESDGAWVRVIAGEFDGKRSPIETLVPTTMIHLRLNPDVRSAFSIAPGSNAIVHAISGSGSVEGSHLREYEVALLASAPESIHIGAGNEGFEALLISGKPIGEPIARYGPFVMNTREELAQAVADLRAGRFGEIARSDTLS